MTPVLSFGGKDYPVNPITDHHIVFLAELYDETGTNLQYDLEKESQALKLITEYICPALPPGLVFVTAQKDYVWMESHQLFAEILVAVARCYATYFDKDNRISEEQKEQLDNADRILEQFKNGSEVNSLGLTEKEMQEISQEEKALVNEDRFAEERKRIESMSPEELKARLVELEAAK